VDTCDPSRIEELIKWREEERKNRVGKERPTPGKIMYRGANGLWYDSEREAKSKYTFSER
jgi:hypothetical protein